MIVTISGRVFQSLFDVAFTIDHRLVGLRPLVIHYFNLLSLENTVCVFKTSSENMMSDVSDVSSTYTVQTNVSTVNGTHPLHG